MSELRRHPSAALLLALAATALLLFALVQLEALVRAVGWLAGIMAPLAAWAAVFRHDARRLAAAVVGNLLFWTNRGQRVAVGTRLEADVALARGHIEEETPGSFTYPLKVSWRRGAAGEPEIEDGAVVVTLQDYRHRRRNLIKVVLAQVARGALPVARRQLEPELSTAIDYSLAKDMLYELDRVAADEFVSEVCAPACQGSPRLAELLDRTRVLDESGYFTRIALREFVGLGQRMADQLPSAQAAKEASDFVEYLYTIVTKDPEQDVNERLAFTGRHINVGVVLVAKLHVYAMHGDEAYLRRVGLYAKSGAPVVYLAARGWNVEFARSIAAALHRHGNVVSVEEFEFQVRRGSSPRPAYLARVSLSLGLSRRAERRFTALRRSPEQQRRQAV